MTSKPCWCRPHPEQIKSNSHLKIIKSNAMSDTSRKQPEFVMPNLRLDGRTALVTGGGRGLGLGMALALAHAGADLALAARTASELEAAAEQVRATGRQALVLPTDVSDVGAVQAM